MDGLQALPFLVQAGAVGISFALIGLLYWVIKVVKTIVGNHLVHSTETQMELVAAIKELTTLIREKLR